MPGRIDIDALKRLVNDGEIETVIAAFPDMYGRLVGKRFNAEFFLEEVVSHGSHACDYLLACDMDMDPVPGYAFTSWAKGYGDFRPQPDFGTMRVASWLSKTALVICDVLQDRADELVALAPRSILRRQVERDAAMLLGGAKVIAWNKKWRLSDPVGHTRHFVDAIRDQTDLRIEATNYKRFHANFAGDPGVRFPEILEPSTERVLTMEFCRGTKIDAQPPERRLPLAATVRHVMMKMCFEDGFLHADMHPGNMVVDDAGRLVLFDVGLAKLLHEDVLLQFIDMGKCLTMGTPDDLVNHLKRFHTYIEGVHWDALRTDLERFALKHRARDAATLDYGSMFNELFAIGRRYHVRPVTDLTLVLVSMVTSQGIGAMLDPKVNVFAEVARYLVPILMKRNESVPVVAPARA